MKVFSNKIPLILDKKWVHFRGTIKVYARTAFAVTVNTHLLFVKPNGLVATLKNL